MNQLASKTETPSPEDRDSRSCEGDSKYGALVENADDKDRLSGALVATMRLMARTG